MKKFIKTVQLTSVAFLIGAPLYLANEGELGVNLTSILVTVSPSVLLIITGIYEVLQYVLPAKTVMSLWKAVESKLGQENTKFVKDTINTITPEQFVKIATKLANEITEIRETVTAIKEKQDNLTNV